MVWILYPQSFESGKHVPSSKTWIEREVSGRQLPGVISGAVTNESKNTPGQTLVIGMLLTLFLIVYSKEELLLNLTKSVRKQSVYPSNKGSGAPGSRHSYNIHGA